MLSLEKYIHLKLKRQCLKIYFSPGLFYDHSSLNILCSNYKCICKPQKKKHSKITVKFTIFYLKINKYSFFPSIRWPFFGFSHQDYTWCCRVRSISSLPENTKNNIKVIWLEIQKSKRSHCLKTKKLMKVIDLKYKK